MTGAWLLWASLLADLGLVVLRNMLLLLVSPVFLLAVSCAARFGPLWPAFDPFDLDDGCRLATAEDALRGTIRSGANIYAVSDSPSQKSLFWDR